MLAPTPGAAILAAERHYEKTRGISAQDSQDRQQVRSGFEDIKLYRMDRIEPTRALPDANERVTLERRL